MRPPERGERFYYSERQMAILDAPEPDWRFYANNETHAEWHRIHEGHREEMILAVHRTEPPDALATLLPNGGTWTREELIAVTRRFEEWFLWRIPGLPVIGWPDDERPDGWVWRIRYVAGDVETPEVLAWIERDLRALGATEPSAWLTEVLEGVA